MNAATLASNECPTVAFWMPPGDRAIMSLGAVEVTVDEVFFPEDHYWKLVDRVQRMFDKSRLTVVQMDQLIHDELLRRGFLVAFRTRKQAGEDIVDYLFDNLRAAGVLISQPVYVAQADVLDSAPTPMTMQDWIEGVARQVPPNPGQAVK